MDYNDNFTNREAPRTRAVTVAGVLILIFIAGELAVIGSLMFDKFVRSRNASEGPRVKVGLMMAFSGGSSAMGYGTSKGVQLAKKQLDADNIDIIQADSKCDPKTAATAVKQLIAKGVIAIIGEGCSSASAATLPAINNAKVPLISPSASSPSLSLADDYFFRVVPPDTFQGAFMAQAIYDRGIRSVGIFYTNEPYGAGMNDVFRKQFESLGGKVAVTTFADPDVIDLQQQVGKLKNAAPQAVFFAPNSVVSGAAAVKLVRESGLNVPFFGADIYYDNTLISNAPEAAKGMTVTSFPTGSLDFKKALATEYQITDQLYAAPQAYDALNAINMAIKKGAKTGEDIKNALPGITFQGVSGPIAFDKNGEISDGDYKYDLFQIQDGKFVLLDK